MNETQTLAGFFAETTLDDIPEHTKQHAKTLILDQIGCQIGNSELPWSQQIYDTISGLGTNGPSTIMAFGTRARADDAAFVNSAFGAGNEIDDVQMSVRTHPGAVVIPAVFAVAEAAGVRDGSQIMLATILGYEAMLRVAWAGMPSLMEYKHHHTPVAVGPFGAGVATAKLLGLDAEGILDTLAVAGSHCGGLMEYTQSGGSVKRIHAGIGAQSGVRSGYFAASGMTGPRSVLEGKRGFLEAFASRENTDRLTLQLGDRFMLDGTGLKNYYAMYRIHAPLRALEMILQEHRLGFAEIDAMRVGVSSPTMQATGAITEPTDELGAQFSMRFCLAATARHTAGCLRVISESLLHDADCLEMARRVQVYIDDEFEAAKWNSLGGVLTVRTVDGLEYTIRQDAPLGSPDNPMSHEQTVAKFRGLAEPKIGATKAGSIVAAVRNLESADIIKDLMPHVVS
jgi:2-methylcitrate dehydratase PrpD